MPRRKSDSSSIDAHVRISVTRKMYYGNVFSITWSIRSYLYRLVSCQEHQDFLWYRFLHIAMKKIKDSFFSAPPPSSSSIRFSYWAITLKVKTNYVSLSGICHVVRRSFSCDQTSLFDVFSLLAFPEVSRGYYWEVYHRSVLLLMATEPLEKNGQSNDLRDFVEDFWKKYINTALSSIQISFCDRSHKYFIWSTKAHWLAGTFFIALQRFKCNEHKIDKRNSPQRRR